MHSVQNLNLIKNKISDKLNDLKKSESPKIIAVSKTFTLKHIIPLIESGHCHFGENKVQEALIKWNDLKEKNNKIKLHMIGKLQTNKVKKAIGLFDFIHSVDSTKLAETLKKNEIELNKKLSYFIQINIGKENQKSGILPEDAKAFSKHCLETVGLNVIGLMVIPPNDDKTSDYFKEVSNLNSDLGFKELSMGMSSDYLEASKYSSTFLRIGSAILGERI